MLVNRWFTARNFKKILKNKYKIRASSWTGYTGVAILQYTTV
jgi:hypothetical protein